MGQNKNSSTKDVGKGRNETASLLKEVDGLRNEVLQAQGELMVANRELASSKAENMDMAEVLMRLEDKVWDDTPDTPEQESPPPPPPPPPAGGSQPGASKPGSRGGSMIAANLQQLRHASEQNTRLEKQVESLKKENAAAEAAAARAELYVMEMLETESLLALKGETEEPNPNLGAPSLKGDGARVSEIEALKKGLCAKEIEVFR